MLALGYHNMDCIKGMAEFPDKYFDLAIVDPPYGIQADKRASLKAGKKYGSSKAKNGSYYMGDWDSQKPSQEYFDELFRVSKKWIIWGGELLYR